MNAVNKCLTVYFSWQLWWTDFPCSSWKFSCNDRENCGEYLLRTTSSPELVDVWSQRSWDRV